MVSKKSYISSEDSFQNFWDISKPLRILLSSSRIQVHGIDWKREYHHDWFSHLRPDTSSNDNRSKNGIVKKFVPMATRDFIGACINNHTRLTCAKVRKNSWSWERFESPWRWKSSSWILLYASKLAASPPKFKITKISFPPPKFWDEAPLKITRFACTFELF